MKKNLEIFAFMSWDNEEWVKNREKCNIRAIALCNTTGYFYEAVNCLRDGSMGEKDENGVYERHWYGDYIDCYGDESESLRPATNEEVALYLDYVPLEDALGKIFFKNSTNIKIIDKCLSSDINFNYVVVEYSRPLWWRIKNFFLKKCKNIW